jgi:predicted transcriptional regulator
VGADREVAPGDPSVYGRAEEELDPVQDASGAFATSPGLKHGTWPALSRLDRYRTPDHIFSPEGKDFDLLDQDQHTQTGLSQLTAELVASYVSNNSVHVSDLPTLIYSVHAALTALGAPKAAEPERLNPPVSIKKSVTADHLISMEDGKRYKALKRHLSGRGLTPAQYRAKWGLPADYPMVAPGYSEQRSQLAKTFGLGRKAKEAPVPAPKRGVRKKVAEAA